MKYEVEHYNPTRTNPECLSVFDGKALAREFVQRGRQYPGSFELIAVYKVNSKGERTYVEL